MSRRTALPGLLLPAAEGITGSGFRLIASSGENDRQEVPHFHLHIFGGRDIGPMLRW